MQNKLDADILTQRTIPKEIDVRGDYFRDQTAIIHSLPFRRMKKKTQVFFAPKNDHICTRIEHVLHVNTVATTICKGLGLDTELAQAIALGHDLGHPPFGHVGERSLNTLLQKLDHYFIHEINSYKVVNYIANSGKGLNLTYAVKDGIISHCGEKFEQSICPDFKVKEFSNINNRNIYPSTYEGCVVRVSDKISYLGRDIEDAIRLKIITKSNFSKEILDILQVDFDTLKNSINSLIIDKLVKDTIDYSKNNGRIGFNTDAFNLMLLIKNFNYKYIYLSEKLITYSYYVDKIINIIFSELYQLFDSFGFETERYTNHFVKPYRDFGNFLSGYENYYRSNNIHNSEIIADYISGMTDDYAFSFCEKVIFPKKIF